MKAKDVRVFIQQGDFKKALSGAKNFRIGVTKEQRSAMRRAYEAIIHPRFYEQLGVDIEMAIQEGITVLKAIV